jgi:ABC-type glutathione transport system ATPase component
MEILRSLGQTSIIATHDPAVAEAVSDRVIVLESGRIADDGPAKEVLSRL